MTHSRVSMKMLWHLEGNDRIQGLAEGDRICGKEGDDAMEGGGGNDTC